MDNFFTGLIFSIISLSFLFVSKDYAFGSLSEMGPGFVPTVTAISLLAIGIVIIVKALWR